jgi:hypothetical protein
MVILGFWPFHPKRRTPAISSSNNDEMALRFKLRADGRRIWPSTITTTDNSGQTGGTVGWAAILAQR